MMGAFASDLFRRKVPHIFGVYLAGGWAVLEFTDFLVNRYVLSPYLTDFALLAWALMIPTVLMLAYLHGAHGPDAWGRFEKIGIPLNLALAAVFLWVTFSGKDLGAATEAVTVEDEEGQTIERVVPKSAFRKSVAIYYFDNESGDTALDWLQYGIPNALQFDLQQDLFVDARYADQFLERLREKGFSDGRNVPLPLKREVAEYLHLGHFSAGTVSGNADQVVVATALYETRRGKLIQERTYTGTDIFAIVDSMSVQLKRDLEIPELQLQDAQDLPVSEMLTTSVDAYRAYMDGTYSAIIDSNWEQAARSFEAAVSEDSQFAVGHLGLFNAYMLLNDAARGQDALQTAMGLLYKLPERTQFTIKAIYYWLIRQDIDKALAAAGMHAELFPQDIQAHLTLTQFYMVLDEKGKAIASMERVLDLDPSRVELLLNVGDLYEAQGESERAVEYYQRYAQESPNDPRPFIRLGDHHRLQGDHEAAAQEYDRAMVVDPEHVEAMTRLALTERDRGRFDAALAAYEEALETSVTAEQRAIVYGGLQGYYELRGQPAEAVAYMHRQWAELESYQGPFNVIQDKLASLGRYVDAGMTAVAFDSLASFEDQLAPPFDVMLPLGALDIYLALEEPDSVDAAVVGAERFVEAFGLEAYRPYTIYAQGRALEMRGDCAEAVLSYRRRFELQPQAIGTEIDLGRCYRKLGQTEEAEFYLKSILGRRPFNPTANYEIALLYDEVGQQEKALEHLRIALDVWADAEPVFERAREAREKLSEFGGS
jgi:tetratricopeptide (TPR) repeat protein